MDAQRSWMQSHCLEAANESTAHLQHAQLVLNVLLPATSLQGTFSLVTNVLPSHGIRIAVEKCPVHLLRDFLLVSSNLILCEPCGSMTTLQMSLRDPMTLLGHQIHPLMIWLLRRVSACTQFCHGR